MVALASVGLQALLELINKLGPGVVILRSGSMLFSKLFIQLFVGRLEKRLKVCDSGA